jgi:hypothetical protein
MAEWNMEPEWLDKPYAERRSELDRRFEQDYQRKYGRGNV